MTPHRSAARHLAQVAQGYAENPSEETLHAIEPAVSRFWRAFLKHNEQPTTPAAMKRPDDLRGRISNEGVLLGMGLPEGQELEDIATRLNRRLYQVARGREDFRGRGETEVLLSILGTAMVRSFYSGLLCCYGHRATESAPFIRQLVETTCQFATVAAVPGAATIWAERDNGKDEQALWKETFERTKKPQVEVRFRAVSADHKEALEFAWGQASEGTHTRWARVMGIPREAENGDLHLDLMDPPHLVLLTTTWLLDVTHRCTEELGAAWRKRDPNFPLYTDGVNEDIPLMHRKYKRILKRFLKNDRKYA